MDDALRERVEALERAVTDGDHDLSTLAAEADARERLEAVESELEDLEDRTAELGAATQALRGYVGNVRSVNRDVEKRAETALAKAESLEDRLTGSESDTTDRPGEPATDTFPGRDSEACENRPSGTVGGHNPEGFPPSSPTDQQKRQGETVDGGKMAGRPTEADSRRCHACGQSRPPQSSDSRRDSSSDLTESRTPPDTDGRDFSGNQVEEGPDGDPFENGEGDPLPDEDPFASEDSDRTGLQRIRELL